MKKVALTLFLVIILIGATLAFTACGSTVIVPGAAWAQTETLLYNIKDTSKDNAIVGTLETKIVKLDVGEYTIDKLPDQHFSVTSNVLKGLRYTQIAKTVDGDIMMESESIFNAFNIIGSYKRVYSNSLNARAYESKLHVSDSKYIITIDGESKASIKVKDTTVSNEILYTALRAYSEIDSEYQLSLDVVDPINGKAESLILSATSGREAFEFKHATSDDELTTSSVNCIVVNISKSTAPIGSTITVLYTEKAFSIKGLLNESSTNQSIHIPVKIIENELVYELIEARAY
ncbi:MAG: hypothetical protein LBE09_09530 [Christensenellaceae bacterium]|jgi:hypothetical protein|nr:hypothetical protein [Christensenellaceae bacterium]